jgi:hypothetical protein
MMYAAKMATEGGTAASEGERTVRRIRLSVAALAASVMASAASAHHSTAMFDQSKDLVLTGVVREMQWTNPHSWIQVIVPDRAGAPVEWSIECGSPNTMSRLGWTKSTLKPGDKVKIVTNPMKDGTAAGMLLSITLPDGRVLGQRAAPR